MTLSMLLIVHALLVCLESSDLIQPELIGLESDLYLGDVAGAEPLQGKFVSALRQPCENGIVGPFCYLFNSSVAIHFCSVHSRP